MAIIRNHFVEGFSLSELRDRFPAWRCSDCADGTLMALPNSLIERQEPCSEAASAQDWWEFEYYSGTFSAVLDCNSCGRSTVVAGISIVEPDFDPNVGTQYDTVCCPKSFTRPPAIFPVLENIPAPVREQLIHAFGHFWNDPDACGSAIRRCVEAMLAVAKVKKTHTADGKRTNISLHGRIDKHLTGKLLNAKAYLMAIKWVGNDTTHFNPKAKTRTELMDALDLLQSVLHIIYDDRSKTLDRIAKTITKRKGKSPKLSKKRALPRRRAI